MSELDWEERGRLAREGLDPVRFLVGNWEGAGDSDGQKVTSRLSSRDSCVWNSWPSWTTPYTRSAVTCVISTRSPETYA